MKRRNLLITSIGSLQCLPSWLAEDRTYDIALIYYPEKIDEETRLKLTTYADFLFYESGFKYEIIKKVMLANPELLDYDYFWMPDHDVLFRKGDVNQLFSLMKDYNLQLGQPSLVNKNRSWKILVNRKLYDLRYINLVEVMCPAFSKSALDICLESFTWSKSGWGLGLLWGKLIDGPKAVIDKLIVEHTQKMDVNGGPLYQKLFVATGKKPEDERDYLVNKFDLDTKIYHLKKVPRSNSLISKFYQLFN